MKHETGELGRELIDDLRALERAEDRDPHVGPSDAVHLQPGRGCVRQLGYRVQRVEPDRDEPDDMLMMSAIGKATHAGIADARRLAHPNFPGTAGWMVEQSVRVPGFERDGALDAYDYPRRRVDDVKTKSGPGFDKVLARGRAWDEDRDQLLLYGLALEDAGWPVEVLSVTYVDRNGFNLPFVDSWSYDRAEALKVADRMHALIDLVTMVAADDLPQQGRGPGMGRPCDSCRWVRRCWQLEQVPEGYTAQSYQLTDEEVAADAAQLILLRREKTELEAAEEWLRARLVGWGGARFIDPDGITREIRWSAGSSRGGHLDSKAVRARYDELGEQPPTLGTAPRLTLPAVK